MGLFDGLIGGVIGAEMATVVNGLIEKHGGVQGVVDQLRTSGLGGTVNSWISDGPNAPVAPADVHKAFGEQTISELAAKSGMTPEELSAKLAEVLPHAINHVTPDGVVPPA
ncbi:MAG TPA: YidB family protein [Rhizomicrobium sp.]|jgi:uncharacterized protein YidB (DUF937 family)